MEDSKELLKQLKTQKQAHQHLKKKLSLALIFTDVFLIVLFFAIGIACIFLRNNGQAILALGTTLAILSGILVIGTLVVTWILGGKLSVDRFLINPVMEISSSGSSKPDVYEEMKNLDKKLDEIQIALKMASSNDDE